MTDAPAHTRRKLPWPFALSVVAHGLLAFFFSGIRDATPARSVISVDIQDVQPVIKPDPAGGAAAAPSQDPNPRRPVPPTITQAPLPSPTSDVTPIAVTNSAELAQDGIAVPVAPATAEPGAGGQPGGKGNSPTGGGSGTAAFGNGSARVDMGAYLSMLQERVGRHKRYPEMALRMSQEGTVEVRVSLNPDGTLAGAPTIAESSGHELLDDEALRIVARAAPYPPLTGHSSRVEIRVPVRFHLDD